MASDFPRPRGAGGDPARRLISVRTPNVAAMEEQIAAALEAKLEAEGRLLHTQRLVRQLERLRFWMGVSAAAAAVLPFVWGPWLPRLLVCAVAALVWHAIRQEIARLERSVELNHGRE